MARRFVEKPVETPEPGETPEPVETPEPGETPEPVETPEPGETPEPIPEIENITKDFERTLIKNAQKEKEAPQPKEGEKFETALEDNKEDDSSSFNWFIFIGGFFLLIVGSIAFLLFKDDNKSDLKEPQAPTNPNKPSFL